LRHRQGGRAGPAARHGVLDPLTGVG